jgi:RNA polymerase sigma-70 factor, ECF subfamily
MVSLAYDLWLRPAAPFLSAAVGARTAGSGSRSGGAGDDADLLRAAAGGDSRALGSLFDRYAGVTYSLLRRMLGDDGEAEDALQEVFLKVWRNASQFDPRIAPATTWILRLARNHAIDRLRTSERAARRATKPLGDEVGAREPADSGPTPAAATALADDAAWVRRCLAELPSEQRVPIELAYFDHLSQSQIAAKLGEPLGTVKTRMRTGLQRLRAAISARFEAKP